MEKYEFKKGEEIILHSEKYGIVRAWAAEDHSVLAGSLSIFRVNVNSESMPGISEMTINTNHWKVYHIDDPEMFKKVLEFLAPYEYIH